MALLPQRQRDQVLLLVCVASLAALGLYFQWVWTPKAGELDTTAERVEALETLNARAERDVKRGSVAKLKAEAERVRGQLDVMRQLVPTGNEVPLLLDQVSSAARAVGLDVYDVQPDSVIVGEHFDVHRYRMGVSGPYHDVAAFLANVGSLTRIVTPQNVQLTPSTRNVGERRLPPSAQRLEAKFDIQTYVAHGAAPGAALATAAMGMSAAAPGGQP